MIRILTLLILLTKSAFGQMDTVYSSTLMNTVISMPSKILLVDPGSQDYAIQWYDDLVIIKAKSPNARPTSLLVKSATEVNMWILAHAQYPKQLLIKFNPLINSNSFNEASSNTGNSTSVSDKTTISNKERAGNLEGLRPIVSIRKVQVPAEISHKVANVLDKPRYIQDIGQRTSGIYFLLAGVYLDSDFIYFQMRIINSTQIAYELDLLSIEHSFSQKRTKRSQAVQGNVFVPLYYNTVNVVLPGEEQTTVYILPIYAFKEKDILRVKLTEHDGGRTLIYELIGKDILNGKTL
ncbi:MAG: DUF4138 domain-containing protein [Cyclobacteriaceae bacterium]